MFFAALLLLLQHSIGQVLSQAPLRLVGGSTRYEGRVEIYYSSTWGTVCDDYWDINDANVVCRQLFQTSAYTYKSSAYFGQGSGTIWLDDVRCSGSETSLDRCSHRGWGYENCGHREDAGVVCNTDQVRLVGGTSIYEGRVEIFHNSVWGTVCDDSWSLNDAHVVCRQLGYGSATAAKCCASFGQGSGTIWLDNVACSGSEQTLASCSANSWGSHNCGHSEDAGVICQGVSRPCVTLATPVHGSKSGSSTALGASVSFSCSLGYTLSGSSRRTCQIDGTWSGTQPTCNAVDCGSLPAPSYGSFSGSSTLYGATIRFSCNAGYSLSGSSSRSCASNGQWSGSQPTCNRIYCPLQSRPSFGSISTSSRTVGTTVTFSCSLGYRLVGSSSRSCEISGSWTGSAASCIVTTCASLSTPLNGVKTGTSVTYGSIVKFSCKSGYTLSGSSSRSCSASGDWTGAQPVCTPTRCPALAPLSHGHMSSTSVSAGTVVSFTCSKGYTLSGSTTRSCQLSGSWSGTQPTCTIVNCGSLSTPSNAVKTGTSTSFGAIVSFTCSQGYVLIGSASRTCQNSGKWSGTQPKCSLVDCGALAAPAHGTKTGSRTTYGARISFQCSLGYVRSGSSSRTCQPDGTWSGTQPSCLIVDCGSLSAPSNGERHGSLSTYASTTAFACVKGFTLQGSKSRTCQANGTWSGQSVSCKQVYCPALLSVINGVRSGSGTIYGSVVKFGCKTGYKLYGSSSRTCQNDGTWSGSQPTCSLQHCSLLSDPPNGKVTGGSSAHGMTMTYVCNAGYNVTSGSRTRSCLAKSDGSVYWSGTAARCTIIDCGRLSALQNGQMTGKSTVYLSTVSLSCNVGYNIGGSVKRTCQANGQWSGSPTVCKIVDCGQLPAPIFGSISGATTYGSSVVLSCRKGFSLFGSSRRTCQADGSWTGAATHCKIVDCGVVKSPTNGQVTVLNTTYGSVASFQCNSGHRLVGPSSRQCQANGQWSSIPTLCDALYCSAIGTPLHGFRQPVSSNFVYGTTLSFTCAQGRTLVGRLATQCVETSQNPVKVDWSNSLPTCDVVPKLALNLTASDRTEQRSGGNLVAYAAGVSQSSGDDPLTLSCYPARGDPVPRVTWYYGQTMVNATPSSAVYQTYDSVTGASFLTLNEFGNKNEGSYKCVAMNRAGKDDTSFTLIQQVVPNRMAKPSLIVLSAWDIEVSWSVPSFDGYTPLTGYDVQYTTSLNGQWAQAPTPSSSSTFATIISNLNPYTIYNVRVRARNKIGAGLYSAVASTKTLQAAPTAPRMLTSVSAASDSVSLSWRVPSPANGIITAYSISYRDESFGRGQTFFKLVNGTNVSSTVTGLLPYRVYQFTIKAKTEEPVGNDLWGANSSTVSVQTQASYPSSSPTVSQARAHGSQSIFVQWKGPAPEDINGVLTGYRISYSILNSGNVFYVSVNSSDRQYNFTTLAPHTDYEIRVYAINQIGQSPGSAFIVMKTGQAPPLTPPLNITAGALSPNEIELKWVEPSSHAVPGILTGYDVFVATDDDHEIHLSYNQNYSLALLTNLVPYTNYTVSVAARTGGGMGPKGPYEPLVVLTHEDVPTAPEGIVVSVLSATSIKVDWQPPAILNGLILSYTVFYWNSSYNGRAFTRDQSFVVENLNEFAFYSLSVAGETVAGMGPRSDEVVTKTFESEPNEAPVLISIVSESSTTINISWAPPPVQSINGLLTFYEIHYSKTEYGNFSDVFNVSSETSNSILDNLEEFVVYRVKIRAYTSAGPGPFVQTERRTIASPSYPPLDVWANSTSSTSIYVEWLPPADVDVNGIFYGFQIQYASANHSSALVPLVINVTSFNLTDLSKWTDYHVWVRVVTRAEDGNVLVSSWTAASPVRTDEDTPESPGAFTIQTVGTTDAILTWDHPDEPNGILIGYHLTIVDVGYLRADMTSAVDLASVLYGKTYALEADQDLVHLLDLHPFTQYQMTLESETVIGIGAKTSIVVKTMESAPSTSVRNFSLSSAREKNGAVTVTLKWEPPFLRDRNGVIKSYDLQYTPEGSGRQPVASPAPGYVQFPDLLSNDGQEGRREVTVTGLDGFRNYSFSLKACTSRDEFFSCGSVVTAKIETAETAPTGSPSITDVIVVSDTSAVVYWTPPPKPERQGILAGYILKLSHAGESNAESASITYEEEHSISADRREYSVYDLEEGKEYFATISAATVAGRGPQSQPTNFSATLLKCSASCQSGDCYVTVTKKETCYCTSAKNSGNCVYDEAVITTLENSKDKGVNVLIIYIAVGAGVGLIILVLIVILCRCWCKAKEGGFRPSDEAPIFDYQEKPSMGLGVPGVGYPRPMSTVTQNPMFDNPVYDDLDAVMPPTATEDEATAVF